MPTHHKCVRKRSAVVALVAVLLLGFSPASAENLTAGPDVTVINLPDITNWGASGGIRAYSVGTTSCNIGDKPVAWCDVGTCVGGTLQSNDHPVIAQGLYRLKDGRFSQIGLSWLKHGWLSTNSNNTACAGINCIQPPGGGDQLGIGCTDTYGSGLNGGSGNPGTCLGGSNCRLGMRSEVNATSGDFPMPYTNIPHPSAIDQRIQVLETDVDPTLNAGSLYWFEGQYIAADDGFSGNAYNNTSYRKATVGASPFTFTFNGAVPTVREKTALHAWKAVDASVEITHSDFCSAPVERFEVGRKVTVVDGDTWHYEYAVRNMNSDHAARRFAVSFPAATPITNVGFKDVDHHSGEAFATTDWTPTTDSGTGTVSWETETFAANNNANALRFATTFNFWFDADAPPETAQHEVSLFKPVTLPTVDAGEAVAICIGEIAHLGSPAVAGQTYSWSPGGATTAQIDVSPGSTTVYTLTAANSCATAQDSVTVTVEPLLATPTLSAPSDGAVDLQLPVSLSWTAVAGATDYTLEVATDAGFTQIVDTRTLAATQAEFATLNPIQYFWRVTANGTCSSAPSTVFDFTITDAIFSDGFFLGNSSAWSQTVP